MKALYYYNRDEENRPMETVCLLINDNGVIVSRGIARCSTKDLPRKSFGRKLAYNRAMAARNSEKFEFDTHNEFFKFQHLPIASGFEKQIINKVLK